MVYKKKYLATNYFCSQTLEKENSWKLILTNTLRLFVVGVLRIDLFKRCPVRWTAITTSSEHKVAPPCQCSSWYKPLCLHPPCNHCSPRLCRSCRYHQHPYLPTHLCLSHNTHHKYYIWMPTVVFRYLDDSKAFSQNASTDMRLPFNHRHLTIAPSTIHSICRVAGEWECNIHWSNFMNTSYPSTVECLNVPFLVHIHILIITTARQTIGSTWSLS